MRSASSFVTVLGLALSPASAPAQEPPYKDAKLPVAQRVADLLARMTVDEKVAQLRSLWAQRPKIDAGVLSDRAKMAELFGLGLGMVNPDFDATLEQTIELRNRVQHWVRHETRLG